MIVQVFAATVAFVSIGYVGYTRWRRRMRQHTDIAVNYGILIGKATEAHDVEMLDFVAAGNMHGAFKLADARQRFYEQAAARAAERN